MTSDSKGFELGAVDYVTNPVNPDVLKLRVRNFMRYVELHKQLRQLRRYAGAGTPARKYRGHLAPGHERTAGRSDRAGTDTGVRLTR